jgi:hypothetical protein
VLFFFADERKKTIFAELNLYLTEETIIINIVQYAKNLHLTSMSGSRHHDGSSGRSTDVAERRF